MDHGTRFLFDGSAVSSIFFRSRFSYCLERLESVRLFLGPRSYLIFAQVRTVVDKIKVVDDAAFSSLYHSILVEEARSRL